ncbi:MAG: response regulator [Kofleriaceae bacterium]
MTRNATAPSDTTALDLLKRVRILVVDDDPDMVAALDDLLASRQATVATASSSSEALAMLAGFKPHVIVSDISMPDGDGYQLMRMVRVRPAHQGGATAAIALTGNVSDHDHARALLAGFNVHLRKPFDPAELCAAVLRVAKLEP